MIESYAPFILLGVVLLAIAILMWGILRRANKLDSDADSHHIQAVRQPAGDGDLATANRIGRFQGQSAAEKQASSVLRGFASTIRNLIIFAVFGAIILAGYLVWIGQLHLPTW